VNVPPKHRVEWNDVDSWKNIRNSQNVVRKKSFVGTFSFLNCHIIGLHSGSLVLIVFEFFLLKFFDKEQLCGKQKEP
jgi:hypothetical protein